MQKFQLSEYLKISGIGAASGIVFTNHSLYIISDNAGYLYQYDLKSDKLTKHQIIKNPSQNIPKKKTRFRINYIKRKQTIYFWFRIYAKPK
ncbi:hypothetical protein FPS14_contig00037-0004 [Flavobacterium psychrophilum]|nr:hypothetical protein FPS14_contig00037-0004 [Flavobacterium psychrophilum]